MEIDIIESVSLILYRFRAHFDLYQTIDDLSFHFFFNEICTIWVLWHILWRFQVREQSSKINILYMYHSVLKTSVILFRRRSKTQTLMVMINKVTNENVKQYKRIKVIQLLTNNKSHVSVLIFCKWGELCNEIRTGCRHQKCIKTVQQHSQFLFRIFRRNPSPSSADGNWVGTD